MVKLQTEASPILLGEKSIATGLSELEVRGSQAKIKFTPDAKFLKSSCEFDIKLFLKMLKIKTTKIIIKLFLKEKKMIFLSQSLILL